MATNFMRSSAMSSLRRAAPEPVAGASSMIPSPLPEMTGISSSSSKSSLLRVMTRFMTTLGNSLAMIAEQESEVQRNLCHPEACAFCRRRTYATPRTPALHGSSVAQKRATQDDKRCEESQAGNDLSLFGQQPHTLSVRHPMNGQHWRKQKKG